jgi:DNA-binding MarR family transcriptional regulator
MGEDVHIGLGPRHQLAVVPDDPFEPIVRLRSHGTPPELTRRPLLSRTFRCGVQHFASGHWTRYERADPDPFSAKSHAKQPIGGRYDPFVLNYAFVTNNQKYVNMADINTARAAKIAASEEGQVDEPTWDIIELLFFAYRDFVGDPDEVLSKFSFGRAHHRVLHFVNRNPGMKVAELLDILRITKQSLGRVLKQLIDQGYVLQREGAQDRRQRLLFVTPKGEALALKLAMLQTERIQRAFAELGPTAHDAARRFLAAMIDAENRDGVIERVMRVERGGKGK